MPQLAQQVNSELTSLFIGENLKSQQQLSEGTTAFLQSQLTDARAKLEEQEAKVRTFPGGRFGRHLRCEFVLPGKRKHGQILVLGHSDTVWAMGTLANMRFRQEAGRLWGPGVLDMKSGIG